jgi:hypothetical protein
MSESSSSGKEAMKTSGSVLDFSICQMISDSLGGVEIVS